MKYNTKLFDVWLDLKYLPFQFKMNTGIIKPLTNFPNVILLGVVHQLLYFNSLLRWKITKTSTGEFMIQTL